MQSTVHHRHDEIDEIREWIRYLAERSTLVDFEEQIQLPSVRSTLRVWRKDDHIVGFAYVDDFNNLWFETLPGPECCTQLEAEIIEWGEACIRSRESQGEEELSLDSTCSQDNPHRIEVLLSQGFVPQTIRSMHFSRSLADPIPELPLPPGFTIRPALGEGEVKELVALHRAAFGTENMTVELRLAMMRAPGYVPELDLLAVAPDGELAALCVCGFEDGDRRSGYTDPIAVHRKYQGRGLGKAILSAGLRALKQAGAERARLGTSSENSGMIKLAQALGFVCTSEQLWFAKVLAAGQAG